MENLSRLQDLKGKLIVSCQALEGEPLYGSSVMAKMALAAKIGGASGIRANSIDDIKEIKKEIDLPIIGIIKREYPDSEVYITPTIKEVKELYEVGVDIIACDFTYRLRPKGQHLEDFIEKIRKTCPQQLIMGDVSTYEEGVKAEALGVDIVSTTLSGYTDYSESYDTPDFGLVERLASSLHIPVIAEGRINYPWEAKKALECGAFAVVVGTAITRPSEITRRFISELER